MKTQIISAFLVGAAIGISIGRAIATATAAAYPWWWGAVGGMLIGILSVRTVLKASREIQLRPPLVPYEWDIHYESSVSFQEKAAFLLPMAIGSVCLIVSIAVLTTTSPVSQANMWGGCIAAFVCMWCLAAFCRGLGLEIVVERAGGSDGNRLMLMNDMERFYSELLTEAHAQGDVRVVNYYQQKLNEYRDELVQELQQEYRQRMNAEVSPEVISLRNTVGSMRREVEELTNTVKKNLVASRELISDGREDESEPPADMDLPVSDNNHDPSLPGLMKHLEIGRGDPMT